MNRMEIITPKDYVGPIMELAQQRRGEFVDMTYLTETRTTLVYNLPLAEVHSFGAVGKDGCTTFLMFCDNLSREGCMAHIGSSCAGGDRFLR